jgi:hypothetical protein
LCAALDAWGLGLGTRGSYLSLIGLATKSGPSRPLRNVPHKTRCCCRSSLETTLLQLRRPRFRCRVALAHPPRTAAKLSIVGRTKLAVERKVRGRGLMVAIKQWRSCNFKQRERNPETQQEKTSAPTCRILQSFGERLVTVHNVTLFDELHCAIEATN